MGLYRDDGLIILRNIDNQQTDKIRKKIIMEVHFLDVTFTLVQNTYRHDNVIYINTSSNHPPQIIKHLTQTISERLSRNSSSDEKFDYEEALKKCDYKAKLEFMQPNLQQINTRRRTQKIIWFNPHFNLNVKTNVAKIFLQLIDTFSSSKQVT